MGYLLTISESILLFISGFGIIQAILAAALLYFHPRSDRSVISFLALYIACISIPMFIPVMQHFFSWQVYVFLAPFTLVIGPSLYLYVRSFKEVITWKKTWPHFILFAIYLVIVWRLSVTLGSRYSPTSHMPAAVLHSPFTFVPISIRLLQMLVYYFLSRKELTSYQRSIEQLFSETSTIDLKWVKWLINGYLILVCTTIGLYSLVLRYTDYFSLFILINGATFTPYIYMATLKGILQPTLWQIQPGMHKEEIEQEMQQAEEAAKHPMTDDKTNQQEIPLELKDREIASRIISLMKNDKLYQEPQFTLQNLADKLQIPAYQVSQVINDSLKKNFYELVNGYRVEEAKRLLLDPKNKNFTILSMGFEAGFNSKTTFNTVFKKFTGFTPTEFRDKQKKMSVLV